LFEIAAADIRHTIAADPKHIRRRSVQIGTSTPTPFARYRLQQGSIA
jgi:hypothetical protein